ncbi:MAG: chromatin remodeling complex protein RSC6 [Gammaproteobacteria bacterium]|jgi:chromatin remodeling complex protein RSC6
MLKRLLIAGVLTSATMVSAPAAAHSNTGERIAAEIILHSVFGNRHVHEEQHRDSRQDNRDHNQHHDSARAERLRRENRRIERRQHRELASLQVREVQLSAQLAAIVGDDPASPRRRTGLRGDRNK